MKRYLLNLLLITFLTFTGLQASSSHANDKNVGPRYKQRSISPWIKVKNNVFVYKFNVFNLDPDNVDQKKLKSILKANKKDIDKNFVKEWGASVDLKLYTADQLSNPKLFKGDRIPFFIMSMGHSFGGFHSNQAVGPANASSFLWEGANISALGLTIPSNFPAWTPYGVVLSSNAIFYAQFNKDHNNPYAYHDAYQILSTTINHELKETITDDSGQNWDLFDNFAPTVATWHYAEFDANGVVTNGTIGPDGYVHLPLFLDVFPAGGLFTTIQENGDPVSRARAGKLNSYIVDGWAMTNHPTSNFWKGYFESDKIKWDHLGYVENPLQPYAALLEELLFLDYNTGLTSFGEVQNWGPVTPSQRGDPPQNNFPPDYTYVDFFSTF